MAKKAKAAATDEVAVDEPTHFWVERTVLLDIRGVSVTFEADRKYGYDHAQVRELKKAGVAVNLE